MRKSTKSYDLKNGFGINCYQDVNTFTGEELCRIEVIMTTLPWEEQVEYYVGKDSSEANKLFKDVYSRYVKIGR